MCRHLAYLGPPVALAELLLDPPHSLVVQSWAPRDMRGGGTVNADGFGVGWYAEPARDRRPGGTGGAAADLERRALPELARGPTPAVPAVLAAVRNATAGMPVAEAAARRSPTAGGCSATTAWSPAGRTPLAGLAASAAAP